jgi:hypothetical protein
MPLNETRIDAVEASVSILILSDEPLIPELRRHFPDITFMRCDAEDMDAAPYRSGEHYQLFLLNRSNVCITLTDQPELADGIIVTKK